MGQHLALTLAHRDGTLLGIVMLLATATQLRPKGSVGLAEDLLVVLLALTWPRRRVRWESALRHPAVLLLVVFAVTLLFGSIADQLLPFVSGGGVNLVGMLPYVLSGLVVFYVALHEEAEAMARRALLALGLPLLLLHLVFLIMENWVPTIGPVELALDGVRFQGWANNPNQLGLFLVIGWFGVAQHQGWHPAWRIAATVAFGWLGLATQSDGLRLAAACAVLSLIVRLTLEANQSSARRVIGGSILIFALMFSVFSWSSLQDLANAEVADETRHGGQSRPQLWASCFETMTASPLVGRGPAPHAVLPDGSRQECHNTTIEVAAMAGLPMGAAFLAFVGLAARRQWRSSPVGLAALVMLFVGASFTYFLRHPAVWLFLMVQLPWFWLARTPPTNGQEPLAVEPAGKVMTPA